MRNGQKVTEKTVPLRHGQRASRCFRKNPKNPFLFLPVSGTEHRVSRATYLILSFPFLSFLILSYPIRKTAEVKENGGRGTPSDYHYHGFTCRFGTVGFRHFLILSYPGKTAFKGTPTIKLIQSVPFLFPVFPLACLILPLRHCRLPTLSYPITKLPGLCEHRWQLNLLNQEATE